MNARVNARLKLMRVMLWTGALLLMAAPAPALAHDNLGGDELSIVNWILLAAAVTVGLGLVAGFWAYKAGQFTNIEESKYNMIDLSEDYDVVMEEADLQAKAAQEQKALTAAPLPEASTTQAEPSPTGRVDGPARA